MPIEAGVVTLTVDTNNDTIVNDADDVASRVDASLAFAFWEADATAHGTDSLVDWATLRIQLPKGPLAANSISLLMPHSHWVLRRKYDGATSCDGKGYLCDGISAAAQHVINELSSDDPDQPKPVDSFGRIAIPSGAFRDGVGAFLFKCVRTDGHGCPSPAIDLERQIRGRIIPITRRRIDIRPIRDWVSIYSARRPGTSAVAPRVQPLEGWTPVSPDWLTRSRIGSLTLLVHGFDVTLDDVEQEFTPKYFKRMYWVGHPVIRRQCRTTTDCAHLIVLTWPGDPGVASYPEAEFRALQAGVPFSRFLVELKKATQPTISILAHSLGNTVVHSALTRVPRDTVTMLLMNQSATAAEAFDHSYVPTPRENAVLLAHAQKYGYEPSGADVRWKMEWIDIQNGQPLLVGTDGLPTEPDLRDLRAWQTKTLENRSAGVLPVPSYELRWSQTRPSGGIPDDGSIGATPQRGSWRGVFEDNLDRTVVLNTFNVHDRVLQISWYETQLLQKPFLGLLGLASDDRHTQFWGRLYNTGPDQEYLWGFSGSGHMNVIRQWAELAYWFPAVSAATGTAGQLKLRNTDFSRFGDFISPIDGHSYLRTRPFAEVWEAYAAVAAHFYSIR
jgi:hypothetical protein